MKITYGKNSVNIEYTDEEKRLINEHIKTHLLEEKKRNRHTDIAGSRCSYPKLVYCFQPKREIQFKAGGRGLTPEERAMLEWCKAQSVFWDKVKVKKLKGGLNKCFFEG